MKTVLIACRIMERELLKVMAQCGCDYPVIWLESSLHDRPKLLNDRLKEVIARTEADRLILTFGLCGNSTLGLCSDRAELILPKTDDCITLFLGSHRQRQQCNAQMAAYYMTEGWINGDKSPMKEFASIKARYGEKRGQYVIDVMYQHYRSLCLLDTGVSDMAQLCRQCEPIARITKTQICTHTGTTDWLRQLLSGPWTQDRFVIKKPDCAVVDSDFANMV